MTKTKLTPLIFLTGKGGTGKSCIAAGLAQHLATQQKRIAIIELGQQSIPRLFEGDPSCYEGVELNPHITAYSLSAHHAFEEYGTGRLGSAHLYRAMFDNRFVHYFLDAVPGLGEIMCLGKIIQLLESRRFDFIIVDLPATGHGLGFLDAPRLLTQSVRRGPLYKWGNELQSTLRDHDLTQVVAICHAEELACNEAIAIKEKTQELTIRCEQVMMNRCIQDPLPAQARQHWHDVQSNAEMQQQWHSLYAATEFLQTRWQQQNNQRAQIMTHFGTHCTSIPDFGNHPPSAFANLIAESLTEWQ